MAFASMLALLLVSAILMAVNAEVLWLTETTFKDNVKVRNDKVIWFVKFHSPWCGRCTNIVQNWDALDRELEHTSEVQLASVDCTKSKALCMREKIRIHPDLVVYYKGVQVKKYEGDLDVQSWKPFIIQQHADLTRKKTKVYQEEEEEL